jgi:hypothetical protein
MGPLHSIFLLKPENSLRNIFVISDGHVNNEETTLKAVHDNCQHTRVFTFGVRYILYLKELELNTIHFNIMIARLPRVW